jgi:hypothetical protein
MATYLLVPRAAAGQLASQWFGTWRVDLARSTYPGVPPFKKMTLRIERWEDDVKVTYDVIRSRGGITHLEWTGKFDGRDYPVQGVDDVVTNAYRRIDDRSYDVIQKVDGVVSLTARMIVSDDGKRLTTVTSNSTAVFDRQ